MHIDGNYPLYCAEALQRMYYYPPPCTSYSGGGWYYGTPWLYIDGDKHGGSDNWSWESRVVERMAEASPVTITMSISYDPSTRIGTVTSKFRNDSTASITGRVIHVVTEDSIYYLPYPGGDMWHNHVARDYLPNQNGKIVTIAVGSSVNVSETFTLAAAWNVDRCNIVTWIQNDAMQTDSTKEIWQGSMTRIIDINPPVAPHVLKVKKLGSDAVLTWNKVTTDTTGSSEAMDYYVVFRNTFPSFVPGSSDSIGVVAHPDTTFTDIGAMAGTQSYYYLVKAVDKVANRSKNSNMGYVFKKFLNENPATTDRNWVSLPWHNNYAVVSALTSDLSAEGNPLIKVTNLRNDNLYESWLWDPEFMQWYGTDFGITSGRGYEMVTIRDTTVVLVGCNEPAGLVLLNENPATTDRNWVSIPYNHVYSTVSDITTEYSPLGNPLMKLTNLRDDNKYESWIWDPDFGEWYGTNFVIERGRGYEMVTVVDTVWNPTEYSNESGLLFVRQSRQTDMCVRLGTALTKDRAPGWVEDRKVDAAAARARGRGQSADGLSHIVRLHVAMKDLENLVFTAYCPGNPYDVLTEKMVGSGIAEKSGSAALWFDVGNFEESWSSGEELLLIVEATKQGRGYFAIVNLTLDNTGDVQDLGSISLVPISDLNLDDENIIGYSMYKGDKRLNTHVLTVKDYRVENDVVIRPVFRGGYETVYGSREFQQEPAVQTLQTFTMNVHPNPSVKTTMIEYALPEKTGVDIVVYDIAGRRVVSIVHNLHEPGYYSVIWDGCDGQGRHVAAGIYFVRLQASKFVTQNKVLFIK